MNNALANALQKMLGSYGHSALSDSNKIIGTIADFEPDNLKERKMINIVIYENIPTKLIEIKNENNTIKEIVINKCVSKLEDEYGMKKEIAEKIISYFTMALAYGKIRNGLLIDTKSDKVIYNNKYFDSLSIDECIELADNNHTKAQVYLGNQYLKGIRVKQDNKKALYWFEKASKKDDLVALCNIAILRLQEKRRRESANL